MRRGEIYRVPRISTNDPKKYRAYVIVSRPELIDSRFSSVICAPIYSHAHGLVTEVFVGIEEGLKHDSSIHCDELVSIRKSSITHYIGRLSPQKIDELNDALRAALDLYG